MQKKLIALAVAGLASGAAFAQTNVTIYGVADSTFDVIRSHGGTASGAASTDIGTFTRVSTNSSLLGFKGEEALGNGLKAMFQFESAVGFDASGTFGATRDSFVGLGGGFGTIKLGKLTGPTRALGAAVDVFAGATGIGTNSAVLGKLGNRTIGGASANAADSSLTVPSSACGRSATCTSVFDSRWNNAIAYTSPTYSGLSGTAVYVANENKTRDGLDNTASQLNTKGYDLGLNYANGPIMAGLTYNRATLGTDSNFSTVDNVSELRLAGSYDFGMATVRALYGRTREDRNNNLSNFRQNVWGLGGTFNVGNAGKIVGQYYKAGDVSGNGTAKEGAALWALGYEHSLSKRTMLKATYAHLNSDRDTAYDFGVNSVGAANTGGTNEGISVGIRHTF